MVIPDLFQDVFDNRDYRKILFTGWHCQVAIMNLFPDEDIQNDLHEPDKVILVISGKAVAVLEDAEGNARESGLKEGAMVAIPAGAKHQVYNNGSESLKLIVIYSPSQFQDDTIHGTRMDAIMDPFDNPEEE